MASLQYGDAPAASRPVMTAEEAEEVIALWSQRQQQAEPFQQLPSVQELSEVLNAPPGELMALLEQVRSNPKAQAKVRRKVSLRSLRVPAAVAGILMLMVVSGTVGWNIGHKSARALYGSPFSVRQTPTAPPFDFSVTFDKYTIPGAGPRPGSDADLMADLQASVESVIADMAPHRYSGSSPSMSNDEFIAKLDAGQAIPGLLGYREAAVKGLGRKAVASIPVLLRNAPTFDELVRDEQSRRIKQMVSSLVMGTPVKG